MFEGEEYASTPIWPGVVARLIWGVVLLRWAAEARVVHTSGVVRCYGERVVARAVVAPVVACSSCARIWLALARPATRPDWTTR